MKSPDDLPSEDELVAQSLELKVATKNAPAWNMWTVEIPLKDWPGGKPHRWPVTLMNIAEVGDELWWYCSPAETWKDLCGRAGWALVRAGNVVDSTLELMN